MRLPMVPAESSSPIRSPGSLLSGFAAFGVCVGLRVDRADLLSRCIEALAPAVPSTADEAFLTQFELVSTRRAESTVGRGQYAILQDGLRVACGYSDAQIPEALAARVDAWIAQRAPRHVFVHAAALSLGGRAVLIPGRSFSGKSTLSAALVKRGALLLSDDYAVLDESGDVVPFLRPARLRPDVHGAVSPVAWRWATEPTPVALVVDTAFDGAVPFAPHAVSRAHGVQALLTHTLLARTAPLRALTTLGKALTDAKVYAGARGEADFAAEVIVDLLADRRAGGHQTV